MTDDSKTIEPKTASILDDISGDSTEDGAKTKNGEVVYEEKGDD